MNFTGLQYNSTVCRYHAYSPELGNESSPKTSSDFRLMVEKLSTKKSISLETSLLERKILTGGSL